VCQAGALLCALPIAQVGEVMRLLPIERIAGAPEWVRGLSVIRGAPVPVIDLALIIGGQADPATRLVALKAAPRPIALAVKTIVGIAAFADDAVGELPPLLRDAATETVTAIGARDSRLIVFLRAARLVPEELLARLDAAGAAL